MCAVSSTEPSSMTRTAESSGARSRRRSRLRPMTSSSLRHGTRKTKNNRSGAGSIDPVRRRDIKKSASVYDRENKMRKVVSANMAAAAGPSSLSGEGESVGVTKEFADGPQLGGEVLLDLGNRPFSLSHLFEALRGRGEQVGSTALDVCGGVIGTGALERPFVVHGDGPE